MLPPGLLGFQMARQQQAQEQAQGLNQLQGLLGVQGALAEQQLMPLKMKQLQFSVADAERKSNLLNGLLGGVVGGKPDAQGGVTSKGGVSGLLGVINNPESVARLKLAGVDFTDLYKFFNTPQKVEGGSMTRNPLTGEERFIPKVDPGMVVGQGNQITPAPRYLETVGAIESAKEGAKAEFDLVDVPDGRGGMIKMTRSQAAQRLSGGSNPAPIAPQQPQTPLVANDPLAGRPQAEIDAIRQVQAASGRGQPLTVTVPAPSAGSAPIQTDSVVGGGLGTTRPKLSESLSPGQKAADEAFGKEYQAFVAGGDQSDQLGNIAKIGDALKTLRSGEVQMGPAFGLQPDSALTITNPRLKALKDNIADVVQRGLRPILGAQFTEKEGENLIKRAFDPSLPAGENAYRLDILQKKMTLALQAKQAAVKYYEENGTLRGFKGQLYNLDDFKNMSFDVPKSKTIKLDDGSKVMAKFDTSVGKYSVTRNGKKYYVEE